MKTFKKILIGMAVVVTLIFANGVYYVFWGQEKSVKKLSQGKELNFYECCSIYSMHSALWSLCWWASPAAATEVFQKQFHPHWTDYKRHDNKFIKKSILSERILQTMKSLKPNETAHITYNGNVSYGLPDKEHKAAMAINPCCISREYDNYSGEDCFVIRVNNTWPLHSKTHIKIVNGFEIIIEEGLFRYLQDKGIIGSYVDEYYYPVNQIISL